MGLTPPVATAMGSFPWWALTMSMTAATGSTRCMCGKKASSFSRATAWASSVTPCSSLSIWIICQEGTLSQAVEAIFREVDPMSLSHLLPGQPVHGHGVDQGPVAIKDQSLDRMAHRFISLSLVARSSCISGSITVSKSPSMSAGRL